MSIIEKLLAPAGKWLNVLLHFFTDVIVKFEFEWINNMFNYTILQLRESPSQFAGVGSSILDVIKNLSSTFILPIAGLIIAYGFIYSFVELIIQRNNMQDFDYFSLFREIFKTAINIIVVTNAFTIAMAFFDVGTWLVSGTTATAPVFNVEKIVEGYVTAPLGESFLIALTSIIMLFIGLGCIAMILLTVWSRMVSIYILIALSPIPLATLLQNGWVGSIGQSFIKLLIAYALQGFVILLIIKIIGTVVSNMNFGTGLDSMFKINIMIGVCAITVMKSLQLSKTVVNAV